MHCDARDELIHEGEQLPVIQQLSNSELSGIAFQNEKYNTKQQANSQKYKYQSVNTTHWHPRIFSNTCL